MVLREVSGLHRHTGTVEYEDPYRTAAERRAEGKALRDTVPREDFPFLAQAALDGRLDLARFVTSTISLDEVPERLPRIGERGEIRTVAVF